MSSVAVIGIGAKWAIGGLIADPIIGIWTCGIAVRPVGACAIAGACCRSAAVIYVGTNRTIGGFIADAVVSIRARVTVGIASVGVGLRC